LLRFLPRLHSSYRHHGRHDIEHQAHLLRDPPAGVLYCL
jgi:hypothetical protein